MIDTLLEIFFPAVDDTIKWDLQDTSSVIIIAFLYFITTIIAFYVLYKTIRYYASTRAFRKQLQPILIMSIFIFIIRISHSITSFCVWYTNENTFLLNNGIFTAFYYAIILYNSGSLMKTYIQVPESREKSYNILLRLVRLSSIGFMAMFILFLLAEIFLGSQSIILASAVIASIIVTFILTWTGIVIYQSYKSLPSKIHRLRMQMLNLVILPFAIGSFVNFVLMAINMMNILDDELPIFIIFSIIQVIIGICKPLGIYWMITIPNWARKRYDLLVPRSMEW